MRLIPAIDLKSGQCVRLLKGQFDQETVYAADPRNILDRYRKIGADWLHVVDLDGARDGAFGNRAAIGALTQGADVSVQVGGGIRSDEAARQMFEAGAERLVIGSAALTHPELVAGWFDQYGAERVALAIDVRVSAGLPLVATHGWQRQSNRSLWQVVEDYLAAGLRHVLCTDIDRDGALAGPNLALYTEAQRRFPAVQWQASGGIRDAKDLEQLAALGISAAVSGKALLEERMSLEELRPYLPNA
jgi:phosphoribosylformimino-5-aminoimidazole carboxamide ribotide isomerase